jgi:PAN domain
MRWATLLLWSTTLLACFLLTVVYVHVGSERNERHRNALTLDKRLRALERVVEQKSESWRAVLAKRLDSLALDLAALGRAAEAAEQSGADQDDLGKRFNNVAIEVNALRRNLAQMEATLDARKSSAEQRQGATDESIRLLGARASKVDALAGEFDRLKANVDGQVGVAKRIDALGADFDRLKANVGGQLSAVDALVRDLDRAPAKLREQQDGDLNRLQVQTKSQEQSVAMANASMQRSVEDSPVVVIGMGGSGTRGFVSLLQKLGVHFVIDGGDTLDLHGGQMGGWPDAVKATLRWLDGRDLMALTDALQRGDRVGSVMSRIGAFFEWTAAKALGELPVVERRLWGWKAPVAGLMLPYIVDLPSSPWRNARVVHVVRDGRDHAFSRNVGPHQYYSSMFGSRCSSGTRNTLSPVCIVEQWARMNTLIAEWAQQRLGAERYVMVHAEDLADRSAQPFAELADRLNRWLPRRSVAQPSSPPPPLSVAQLCCAVFTQRSEALLGSHDEAARGVLTAEEAAEFLSRQYVKWSRNHDDVAPELTERFGVELAHFGYGAEPHQFLWRRDGDAQLRCDTLGDYASCQLPYPPDQPYRLKLSGRGADRCAYLEMTDFPGHDAARADTELKLPTPEACCQRCKSMSSSKCTHFSWDTSSTNCFLKHIDGASAQSLASMQRPRYGLISGIVK